MTVDFSRNNKKRQCNTIFGVLIKKRKEKPWQLEFNTRGKLTHSGEIKRI